MSRRDQLSANFPFVCLAKAEEVVDRPAVENHHIHLFDSFFAMVHFSIDQVAEYWNEMVPTDHFFLRPEYLSVLEQSPPKWMKFLYVTIFEKENVVGVLYLQTHLLKMNESLQVQENFFKKWMAEWVQFRLLILGNALLTGEHGLYFCEPYRSASFQTRFWKKILPEVLKVLRYNRIRIDVVVAKDFFERQGHDRVFRQLEGFTALPFQPSMILDMEPEWAGFQDYLSAMSSKYRVRYRRAVKKIVGLKRVNMSKELIVLHAEEMYRLYLQVGKNADFNLFTLHHDYFPKLKEQFQEDFKVTGYFKNEELIGFSTLFLYGKEAEAHFLGFDESANQQYQLYLNILYHIVEAAMEAGKSRVVFARTAMEIKSSIGAQPHTLNAYLKHTNYFLNCLLPMSVKMMEPKVAWVPRHPFKTDHSEPKD